MKLGEYMSDEYISRFESCKKIDNMYLICMYLLDLFNNTTKKYLQFILSVNKSKITDTLFINNKFYMNFLYRFFNILEYLFSLLLKIKSYQFRDVLNHD